MGASNALLMRYSMLQARSIFSNFSLIRMSGSIRMTSPASWLKGSFFTASRYDSVESKVSGVGSSLRRSSSVFRLRGFA